MIEETQWVDSIHCCFCNCWKSTILSFNWIALTFCMSVKNLDNALFSGSASLFYYSWTATYNYDIWHNNSKCWNVVYKVLYKINERCKLTQIIHPGKLKIERNLRKKCAFIFWGKCFRKTNAKSGIATILKVHRILDLTYSILYIQMNVLTYIVTATRYNRSK